MDLVVAAAIRDARKGEDVPEGVEFVDITIRLPRKKVNQAIAAAEFVDANSGWAQCQPEVLR